MIIAATIATHNRATRTLLIDTAQPQLLWAEATPEDMTIAATIAAKRRATRIFLIDIGVGLLFRVPVLCGLRGHQRVGGVVLRECHDRCTTSPLSCNVLGHPHKLGGSRRLCWTLPIFYKKN